MDAAGVGLVVLRLLCVVREPEDAVIVDVPLKGTLITCPIRSCVGEIPELACWMRAGVVAKCRAIAE